MPYNFAQSGLLVNTYNNIALNKGGYYAYLSISIYSS